MDAHRFASHLGRLRLRHLEILPAIAANGSLSATARALGLAQPTLSQWLVDLEEAVGAKLFVRGRTLKPTAALEVVLRHARRMVADSKRLEHDLLELGSGSGAAETLHVGAMPVAAAELVPAALVRLQRVSKVRVSLVEDIAQSLWARFERREIDVFVGRLDARAHVADVASQALFTDRHCVVAAPGHPILRGRPTWARAAASPWILPSSDTPLRAAIDATFVDAGLPPPMPWLVSTSALANLTLMRQTRSLGVLSEASARRHEATRQLRRVALRLGHDVGPVGMAWDRADDRPALQRFLAALRGASKERAADPSPSPSPARGRGPG